MQGALSIEWDCKAWIHGLLREAIRGQRHHVQCLLEFSVNCIVVHLLASSRLITLPHAHM